MSMFNPRGGGTDLERGYGDVWPWRPPFHASPAARKGPISSKRVSSQDPLLKKIGNFSLNSLNFHPNFSSQAPKSGNFQLTSPQIGKFSAHKPPNWEIFRSQAPPFQRQMSVRKPHTWEIRAAHPYLKKSWVPPLGFNLNGVLTCLISWGVASLFKMRGHQGGGGWPGLKLAALHRPL